MSIAANDQRSLNSICAAEQTVIAEFSAPGCTPCALQERLVDGAIHDLGGATNLVKVDVNDAPELAARFNVRSVPTVIVVKDGKVTSRFSGLIDRGSLASAASGH